MAAICSFGFLCGLALAPRARKPSRWWQDLRHFVIAFVLDLVNLQVGVQCDFRLKRVLTCVVSAREKRMETQPVEYLRSGKNFVFLQLSRLCLIDLFSKVLKSPTLLLVMAGNVPATMAVYITYTYLPTVTK